MAIRHLDQGKPVNDISPFDVFFDDLGNVFRLDLAIPGAFGLDENGDADRAKSNRAALCQDHFTHRISTLRFFSLTQAFGLENALKFGFDIRSADLGT